MLYTLLPNGLAIMEIKFIKNGRIQLCRVGARAQMKDELYLRLMHLQPVCEITALHAMSMDESSAIGRFVLTAKVVH